VGAAAVQRRVDAVAGGVDFPLVFHLRVMPRRGLLPKVGPQDKSDRERRRPRAMRTVVGRRLRDVDVG
jgi:hypothetical protein